MEWIDLTLPTPAENLALDELLLVQADAGTAAMSVPAAIASSSEAIVAPVLRFWEPVAAAVVVGRASRVADEVELSVCETRSVPVLRRVSGGAAVVALPGCLMYALIWQTDHRLALTDVEQGHRLVLEPIAAALRSLGVAAERAGTSDLAVAGRKVSGNSMRALRRAVLYHGTLLYNADLDLVANLLRNPPRQPEYRRDRDHRAFVANLNVERSDLVAAVRRQFDAHSPLNVFPAAGLQQLVAEKYSQDSWNRQR